MSTEYTFNFTGVPNGSAITLHLHGLPADIAGSLASMADSLTKLVAQGDDKTAASALTADVNTHAAALAAALPNTSQ
jgi:hypothetical protein